MHRLPSNAVPVKGEGRAGGLFAAARLFLLVLILAACDPAVPLTSIADIQLPLVGTFQVKLTGGVEAEFSGQSIVTVDPGVGHAIYLTGERYSVNLVMPRDQSTGTYAVRPLLDAFDSAQTVVAVGGLMVDNTRRPEAGSISPVYLYADIRAGKATLISVNPMTGAFEFTATDSSGVTVNVYAVFNALPRETGTP